MNTYWEVETYQAKKVSIKRHSTTLIWKKYLLTSSGTLIMHTKKKFSIKNFFSKSDQIRRLIMKKSLKKNFIFLQFDRYRCSRPDVFCEKGVLRNFTKFTTNHLCQSLFFNKVANVRPQNTIQTLEHSTTVHYPNFIPVMLCYKI